MSTSLIEGTTVTPRQEWEWYDALNREDCVFLIMLLDVHPGFLKVGWKEEPYRIVGAQGQRRPWMGRTALHVGARKGCLKLVRKVLAIFHAPIGSEVYLGSLEPDPLDPEPMPVYGPQPSSNGSSFSPGDGLGTPSTSDMKSSSDRSSDSGHMDFYEMSHMMLANGRRSFAVSSKKMDFLNELLSRRDGEYLLDAMGLAMLINNQEIVRILNRMRLNYDTVTESISFKAFISPNKLKPDRTLEPVRDIFVDSIYVADSKKALRDITSEVVEGGLRSFSSLRSIYEHDEDFNFLPIVYMFHFTFKSFEDFSVVIEARMFQDEMMRRIATSPHPFRLLSCLLELRDGQGRTPLHVAVHTDLMVARFFELIINSEVGELEDFEQWWDSCSVPDVRDSVGRTPLHRAAAIGSAKTIEELLVWSTNVNEPRRSNHLRGLTRMQGVGGSSFQYAQEFSFMELPFTADIYFTSLYTALIHKRDPQTWKELLNLKYNLNLNSPVACALRLDGKLSNVELKPIELAVLLGDTRNVNHLLQDMRVRADVDSVVSAFHNAAKSGNFQVVRSFIDSGACNLFAEDTDGNTALHHATAGGEYEFDPPVLDYIDCLHAKAFCMLERGKKNIEKRNIERQGCIDMLINEGLDIWKRNEKGQVPYPSLEASTGFLSWWYKRLAKETQTAQNTLSAAAGSISVTAALVATASFVGPLQPPLSYSADSLQVTSLSVRVFIICNTLSFYLALASIMLAIIPTLPMPQESTKDELRRTRRIVIIAVSFLFPSIISILVAFASGSAAVIPEHGAWNRNNLTLVTVYVGGLICSFVAFLFSLRLMRLVFYKDPTIRKLYKTFGL